MRAVYKYQIAGFGSSLYVPKGGKVLNIGHQHGVICLWIEVETSNEVEERAFMVFATGAELSAKASQYHGTVTDGRYVWHVYELSN